jgi:hypothetical protein
MYIYVKGLTYVQVSREMSFFNQDQGMRNILPQAYTQYSKDKILSIT